VKILMCYHRSGRECSWRMRAASVQVRDGTYDAAVAGGVQLCNVYDLSPETVGMFDVVFAARCCSTCRILSVVEYPLSDTGDGDH
jgi:hypothetical protein